MNLDRMAADANERITQHINRSAGQHIRWMRESWPKQNEPIKRTDPDFPDLPVWYVGDEPSPAKQWAWQIAGWCALGLIMFLIGD